MKRLLLSVLFVLMLSAILMNAGAAQYTYPDYPDVFWDNVTYMGEKIDLSVPAPDFQDRKMEKGINYDWENCNHENWYLAYLHGNREVCDTMTWGDITFSFSDEPPFQYRGKFTDVENWKWYFNELYHDAQRSILNDTAFDSFWHGLRFNGKAVDPFTAPPNYVKALDPWADQRADIGYGLYWSHYFTTVDMEYLSDTRKQRTNAKAPTWAWYGAAFDLSLRPPGFIESNVKTDPIHLNRLARGYLDCWEQYFIDLYEANVPTPDESAGEYYARIILKDKGSYLNVRAKASSSSKSLAKIKNNQTVIVLGKPDKDGWVKVIYRMDVNAKKSEDGTYTVSVKPGYGYLKANYLSKAA